MHLLLVNDDGILSKGLQELAKGLPKEWRITIIAPDRERSGQSHALTLRTPLCLKKFEPLADNITAYSFTGTPTDCTKFALDYFLKDDMPDLVLSGINRGYNLGSDVLYSGTVSAAMEAAFYHIPAMALSTRSYMTEAGKEIIPFIVDMIQKIFIESDYKGILNVNFPVEGPFTWDKVQVVHQGLQRYMDVVSDSEMEGADDEMYFEIKGTLIFEKEDYPTDVGIIGEGFITLTPLIWKQESEKDMVLLTKKIKSIRE